MAVVDPNGKHVVQSPLAPAWTLHLKTKRLPAAVCLGGIAQIPGKRSESTENKAFCGFNHCHGVGLPIASAVKIQSGQTIARTQINQCIP
jgi:hypothetical protein